LLWSLGLLKRFLVGSIITLLFRASSKFRLIYCFFLVKSWFFIEKVHILRIIFITKYCNDPNGVISSNVVNCSNILKDPNIVNSPNIVNGPNIVNSSNVVNDQIVVNCHMFPNEYVLQIKVAKYRSN
jgi:hypothetical protein